MTKLIKITRQDISLGEPYSVSNCPVARAVIRTFKTQDVVVTGLDIEVKGVPYTVPQSVIKFVMNYDLEREVEPFSFKTSKIVKKVRKTNKGINSVYKLQKHTLDNIDKLLDNDNILEEISNECKLVNISSE